MSSLENLSWTARILLWWRCMHVGRLLHAQWHETTKHVNRKPNPRETWGASSFPWSSKRKQMQKYSELRCLGDCTAVPNALFKHCLQSTVAWAAPSLQGTVMSANPKDCEVVALAYKATTVTEECPAPYMEAQYTLHTFNSATGNSPSISCSFLKQ